MDEKTLAMIGIMLIIIIAAAAIVLPMVGIYTVGKAYGVYNDTNYYCEWSWPQKIINRGTGQVIKDCRDFGIREGGGTWAYPHCDWRTLSCCARTDGRKDLNNCTPAYEVLASEDFDDWNSGQEWEVGTSGSCNNNNWTWDAFQGHSQDGSYYLRAGHRGGRYHDCKVWINRSFSGVDLAGKTLSFWYRSQQGAHSKRYFKAYVNQIEVWSANNVAPGEWRHVSIDIPEGNYVGGELKLEVFFDNAWTASTSGWYDDVEIIEI